MNMSVSQFIKRQMKGLVYVLVAACILKAQAVTLSIGLAPLPGPYDLYNFAGADMDMHNVYLSGSAPATNGPANDGVTYVANDRTSQGQTFTTGSSDGGYLLTDLWVRHCGYTANTEDPSTPNSNGTWWEMAGGGGLTLRITSPPQAGTCGLCPGFRNLWHHRQRRLADIRRKFRERRRPMAAFRAGDARAAGD